MDTEQNNKCSLCVISHYSVDMQEQEGKQQPKSENCAVISQF